MKHLIVFAHPNIDSFNHAILDVVDAKLKSLGESVVISDLYQQNFNPCFDIGDFRAVECGTPTSDILKEQNNILEADKITFICPIWWSYFPAIMKGYIDRVFTENFAYKIVDGNIAGLLAGKKFGMINTLDATKEECERMGTIDAFKTVVDKGIFEFCDSPLCFHKFLYNISKAGDGKRQEMLDDISQIGRAHV